jgi:hypothetical protein
VVLQRVFFEVDNHKGRVMTGGWLIGQRRMRDMAEETLDVG